MAIDLFRRIYIAGVDTGQNLSNGRFLESSGDNLIHTLEWLERKDNQAALPQFAPPIVEEDLFNSDDLEFITEHPERLWIQELVSDVTDGSDAYNSTDLWFLHLGSGMMSTGSSFGGLSWNGAGIFTL